MRVSVGFASLALSSWVGLRAVGCAEKTAPAAPVPIDVASASAAPSSPKPTASATPPAIGESDGDGTAGIGEGGGGRGEGIGLGNPDTPSSRIGVGAGSRPPAPSIKAGAVSVTGKLPTEVVQRIVRQNFGRFRLCYDNGLATNPALAGRVTTTFVIDAAGMVTSTTDSGSTLPDSMVVGCVRRSMGNLSFPSPESGTVTVVYPLDFAPPTAPSAPPPKK